MVLFQTIQFFISTQFIPILHIDRTLSGATTPGQSGPRNDGNGRFLPISQRYSITGTSPSDCLVSYTGHSFGGRSYPAAEMQSVYSTTPAGPRILSFRHPWPSQKENKRNLKIDKYLDLDKELKKNNNYRTSGWWCYQLFLACLERSPKV